MLGWTARHSDLRNIVATAWKWHTSRQACDRATAAAN